MYATAVLLLLLLRNFTGGPPLFKLQETLFFNAISKINLFQNEMRAHQFKTRAYKDNKI